MTDQQDTAWQMLTRAEEDEFARGTWSSSVNADYDAVTKVWTFSMTNEEYGKQLIRERVLRERAEQISDEKVKLLRERLADIIAREYTPNDVCELLVKDIASGRLDAILRLEAR